MKADRLLFARIFAVIILLAIFVVRVLDLGGVSQRIDEITLGLLVLAVVIIFVPWDRLKSFEAAGVKIDLEQPQVAAALSSVIEGQAVKMKLEEFSDKLTYLEKSKVLWVDDKPLETVAERRLFRSLGTQVVYATRSKVAEDILVGDGDFDLVVTDISRPIEYDTAENTMQEGLTFIKKVREMDFRYVRDISIVVYTWDDPEDVKFIASKMDGLDKVFDTIPICRDKVQLVEHIVQAVTASRVRRINTQDIKKFTEPRTKVS